MNTYCKVFRIILSLRQYWLRTAFRQWHRSHKNLHLNYLNKSHYSQHATWFKLWGQHCYTLSWFVEKLRLQGRRAPRVSEDGALLRILGPFGNQMSNCDITDDILKLRWGECQVNNRCLATILFLLCFTIISVCRIMQRRMIWWLMNNEWERLVWKRRGRFQALHWH